VAWFTTTVDGLRLTAVIVARVCTTSAAAPLLPLCTLVAVNVAVSLCVPVPRLFGVTVTWQVDTPGVAVEDSPQLPVIVSPESELIATVPLGYSFVPAASVSVTVTVAVELWLTATVDGLRLTEVLVERVVTVWDTPAEVLGLKLLSPAYFAVRVLVPAACGVIWQLPAPALSVIVQVSPAPSSTVTEPVGVPVPGEFTVTETLTVTAWFTTDGFGVFAVIVVVVSALFTVSWFFASDWIELLLEACT
jgi:hypothetical protein